MSKRREITNPLFAEAKPSKEQAVMLWCTAAMLGVLALAGGAKATYNAVEASRAAGDGWESGLEQARADQPQALRDHHLGEARDIGVTAVAVGAFGAAVAVMARREQQAAELEARTDVTTSA